MEEDSKREQRKRDSDFNVHIWFYPFQTESYFVRNKTLNREKEIENSHFLVTSIEENVQMGKKKP